MTRCSQRIALDKREGGVQCSNAATTEVQMRDRNPKNDWWFALCDGCYTEFIRIYDMNASLRKWRERKVA